jgi:hypothetical protein
MHRRTKTTPVAGSAQRAQLGRMGGATNGRIAMAKKHATCTHDNLELRLHAPDTGEIFETKAITRQEVEAYQVSQLPDREAMSLVNANLAAPINAAIALNALSDSSTAVAIAQQNAPITQRI